MKHVKGQLEKFLSVIITCAMIVTMVPIPVHADTVELYYIDENGNKSMEPRTCQAITADDSEWTGNWYSIKPGDVKDSEFTVNNRVNVTGDVSLILPDNCKLKIPLGIHVTGDGNSLTIYSESTGPDMGRLTIEGVKAGNAGIGGNAGCGEGTPGEHAGTIIINSGNVTVHGGTGADGGGGGGAGIGGGGGVADGGGAGTSSCITVNGGVVTATGGNGVKGCDAGGMIPFAAGGGGGAGIGGGGGGGSGKEYASKCGDGGAGTTGDGSITITGGQVEATGGTGGVPQNGGGSGGGIGGGAGGSFNTSGDPGKGGYGGRITIRGGRVFADRISGGDYGGGRWYKGSSDVTIAGGIVHSGVIGIVGTGNVNSFTTNIVDANGSIVSYGNAVIIANSIADTSGKDNDIWSGVIFESEEDGKVYTANGKHSRVTPTDDFTVPENKQLIIDALQTLIITKGVTMTVENSGTVTVNNGGTIIVGVDGTLQGEGTLTRLPGGKLIKFSNQAVINVPKELTYTGEDLRENISIELNKNEDKSVQIMNETFTVELDDSYQNSTLEITYSKPGQTKKEKVDEVKDAGQYTVKIQEADTEDFEVKAAELTVEVTVKNKKYDKTQKAEIQSAELRGTIYVKDDVQLSTQHPSATFANAGPGDNIPITFAEGFKLTGTRSFNYCVAPQNETITANIISTDSALDEITKAADAKNTAIEDSTALTDDEKAMLKQEVANEVTKATEEINNAQTNKAVEEAKNAGVNAINKIEVPGTSTDTPANPEPADPENPTNPDNNSGSTPDPDKGTSTFPSVEQSDPKESWGELIYHGGIPHYVSADGTTSVEVTSNGMIWLKEESDGTSAWYGLDNSSGEFAIGSRFHVRWLSKKSDTDEWDKYYAQLDKEHKDAVENNKLWIFLIGVTHPNGTEYTKFSRSVPLYIQLGDDWDKDDINAVFISAGKDEVLDVTYSDGVVYPEGTDTFAKLTLNHFSPYAVYDKLNDARTAEKKVSPSNAKSTGDIVSIYLTSFSTITILLVTAYILIKRKKRSE